MAGPPLALRYRNGGAGNVFPASEELIVNRGHRSRFSTCSSVHARPGSALLPQTSVAEPAESAYGVSGFRAGDA